MYPFQEGKCWETTIQLPENNYTNNDLQVTDYFSKELLDSNWGVSDNGDSAEDLIFKDFKISGVQAENPCRGTFGYVGYKDNMIRLLSLSREEIGCGPPSQAFRITAIHYRVFISDPVPVEAIVSYIKSH